MITLEAIKELAGEYISVDGGRYIKLLCPFHDDRKTPSLLCYPDFFICKGCDEQGSLHKLANQLRQGQGRPPLERHERNFLPAYEQLDDLLLLWRRSQTIAQRTQACANYLRKRGLKPDRARYLGLGWWSGWLTMPVLEPTGSFRGLVLRAGGQQKQRFLMPVRQPAMLYVPDWTLYFSEPCLFLVFGMLDAISVASLGFAAVTTTAGKDSFDPSWLRDYRKPIFVWPDRGEEETGRALAQHFDWRGREMGWHWYNDTKDPNDLLVQDWTRLDAGLRLRRLEVTRGLEPVGKPGRVAVNHPRRAGKSTRARR